MLGCRRPPREFPSCFVAICLLSLLIILINGYVLATAERVPVVVVIADVESFLVAALKGDAPKAINSSIMRMFPAAAATCNGVSAANELLALPFTCAPCSNKYLTHFVWPACVDVNWLKKQFKHCKIIFMVHCSKPFWHYNPVEIQCEIQCEIFTCGGRSMNWQFISFSSPFRWGHEIDLPDGLGVTLPDHMWLIWLTITHMTHYDLHDSFWLALLIFS